MVVMVIVFVCGVGICSLGWILVGIGIDLCRNVYVVDVVCCCV